MILVTGGTGFIGQTVVRELVRAGHQVRILARSRKKAKRLSLETGCEVIFGDLLNSESLNRACQGTQAVIHTVGILFEWGGATYEKIHVDATHNLLKAMSGQGIRRLVYVSALGTRAHARSAYHQSKWRAEEFVRTSNLDWTILRPSLVWGSGDKSINLLACAMRWPLDFLQLYTWPNLGEGAAYVQPVAVQDVAQACVRALSNPETVSQTYALVGPEIMTWSQLLAKIAGAQGHSVTFESWPWRSLLRAGLWAFLTAFPFILAAMVFLKLASFASILAGSLLWFILVMIARRWRTFILYQVPTRLVENTAWLLKAIFPPWPFGPDFFSMLQEDNIADTTATERLLDRTPEAFKAPLAKTTV